MVLGIGGNVVEIIIRAKDEFSRSMGRLQKSLKANRAGFLALTAAGTAVAVGLGFAVKKAIDFESAFTGVRKTVDLTEKEFGELENRFKTLSTEIPTSFVELSRIGEIAGQLGVQGVDDITIFTKAIADIAASTELTAEDAAISFARIAAIMGEPISNIRKMGSAVVELGNNLETNEREILSFATRISAVGKSVGLTTANIFAISAAFSAVGIQAELGGSAVIRVLTAMDKSVDTSDDKLFLFAKTAGLSVSEFTELFQRDAALAFELFVTGLTKGGSSAAQTLDDLGLSSVRILQAFGALSEAQGKLSESFKLSDEGFMKNIALTEESEKRYGTLESRLKTLKNQFEIFAAEVGTVLTPLFDEIIIPGISTTLERLRELPDATKEIIIIFLAAFAAASLLFGILGTAAVIAIALGTSFIALAVGLSLATLIIGLTAIAILGIRRNQEIVRLNTLKFTKFWVETWNKLPLVVLDAVDIMLIPLRALIDILNSISGFFGFGKIATPTFGEVKRKGELITTGLDRQIAAAERALAERRVVEAFNLGDPQNLELFTRLPPQDVTVSVFLDGEQILSRAQTNILNNRTSI